MPREPRVDLSNQFYCDLHAFRVRFASVQRPISEVLVDVPHALAAALGSRAQQSRAIGAQANRREPPSHDQLIPPGNARFQALDHERASVAVKGEAQAVHPLRVRFQIVLVEQSARHLAQQILEYTAEFSQAGLSAAYE